MAPTKRRRARPAAEGERVRLRIGNLAKAVLVTGQAYQEPKDALNEFVPTQLTTTPKRVRPAAGSGSCCAARACAT